MFALCSSSLFPKEANSSACSSRHSFRHFSKFSPGLAVNPETPHFGLQIGNLQAMAQFLSNASKSLSGTLADLLSPARMIIFGTLLTTINKPMFALSGYVFASFGTVACLYWVTFAKVFDRMSKGVREAPGKALIGELAAESGDKTEGAFGTLPDLSLLKLFRVWQHKHQRCRRVEAGHEHFWRLDGLPYSWLGIHHVRQELRCHFFPFRHSCARSPAVCHFGRNLPYYLHAVPACHVKLLSSMCYLPWNLGCS